MDPCNRFDIAAALGNLGDELRPLRPETHRAMLMRMGRNLLLFNQIEGSLKHVLPYVHPDGAALGSTAHAKFRRNLQQQPLGPTVRRLVESISSSDIDKI